MEPLNLRVDPRGPFPVNRSQFNNPNFPEVRYDPTRARSNLAPVNSATPGSQWSAKPLPPSTPTGTLNPSPAAPTLTARPLSGPVAAPPVAKIPTAPRGLRGNVGNLGPALGAAALLPSLVSAIGDAAGDTRNLAKTAFAAGQNPGRGNLTVALALPFTAPFALAGIASRNGRPANVPGWLWPFPDPPGPNDLDPAALEQGPEITPGSPSPVTGGQSSGVSYLIFLSSTDSSTGVRTTTEYGPRQGPITITRGGSAVAPSDGCPPGTSFSSQYTLNAPNPFVSGGGGCFAFDPNWTVTTARADGQPDTGGNQPGGVDPVRAPNPARQAAASAPRPLPSPFPAPDSTGLPWPQVAPQPAAQPAPFAEPPPAPNFTATPTPEPVPSTAPGITPAPTDLDAPRETPPNLADDPLTPPVGEPLKPVDESKPTGWLVNGKGTIIWGGKASTASAGDESEEPRANRLNPVNFTTATLAVAIPVVLLDGLRQKINTPSTSLIDKAKPNPNLKIVTPPPVQTVTTPNPPTCIYERERVRDIQNKATDVQAKASNPISGFPGLYGLQIEARAKLGQTFTLLEGVNNFMKKAWETTRIQKLLNLLTFVGVMHNVSMLSRDIGETFFYLIAQGLDIVGIDDEEGNALNIQEIVGTTVNNYLISLFGEAFVEGARDSYRKANRIVQSASMVIWTIRSIQDSSLDLMEWVAENTGKIGNSLKRFGVVGDRAYPWMSERAQARDRNRARFDKLTNALESTEDKLSSFSIATSGVLEVQQETQELGENWGRFKESLNDVPDPWFNNEPVQNQVAVEVAASVSPTITAADAENP